MLIQNSHYSHYFGPGNQILSDRQTESRLPCFELLIMWRGEQKFIHPTLMQSHLVPLQL